MADLYSKDELKKIIVSEYEAALAFAKPIFSKRLKYFKMYLGLKPTKKYKSEANSHIPYGATLVEMAWALLTARMPFGNVEARNPERDRKAADLMKELIAYTCDVNKWKYKFLMWQKDTLWNDTAWLKVPWKYADKKTDHPTFEVINPDDIVVHPNKLEMDDRWGLYHKSEMTKSQMIEMGWDKRAINALKKSSLKDSDYRNDKLRALGFTKIADQKENDKTDDLFEVVECFEKRALEVDGPDVPIYVVIANREKIINKPINGLYTNPYKHGQPPYVPLYYDKNPHFFYGISAMEKIYSLNQELNTLQNMKVVNYIRRNYPPIEVEKNSGIDLSTLVFENCIPWLVNKIGQVKPFVLPDLSGSIDNQQLNIKTMMQNRLGVNDVMLVSNETDIKGGNTYGGAAIANENTKLRFKPNATLIDEAVEMVGDLTISCFQDETLFDRKKAIAIADKEGEFKNTIINPQDIKGELVYRVQSLSTIAESKTVRLDKLINIKELYAENQSLKQENLDKQIFDAADLDYESLMKEKPELIAQAADKLQEMAMMANRPEVAALPLEKRNNLMASMQNLRNIVAQGAKSGQ